MCVAVLAAINASLQIDQEKSSHVSRYNNLSINSEPTQKQLIKFPYEKF